MKSYYFGDGNDITKSKENTDSGNFFTKLPWQYIIIGIIIICIIYSINIVLQTLAQTAKPLIEAGGNIMQQLANLLGDCTTQYDCSLITGTCDQCKQTKGCGCAPDQKSCLITSGRKAGSGGGIFSCGLYIISLAFILAPLLLVIVKFFMNKDPSPRLAESAKNSGKDIMDLAKDFKEKFEAEINKIKDDYKEKNGKEISTEGKTLIEKTVAQSNLSKIEIESAKDLPLSDKQTVINQSKANYDKNIQEIQDAAKELDKTEQDNLNDSIDDTKPDFEIK